MYYSMAQGVEVKVYFLHPEAKTPARRHDADAGWDIFSIEDVEIRPRENKKVGTGLRIEIPRGYYAQIAARSGLSLRKKLFIMAGVIDRGYAGEIEVLLYNAGEEAVCLPKHARIAQLLFIKIADPIAMVRVSENSSTPPTSDRGDKGFGRGTGLF